MKIYLFACIAALCLAVVGSLVLTGIQQPASEAFSTHAARVS